MEKSVLFRATAVFRTTRHRGDQNPGAMICRPRRLRWAAFLLGLLAPAVVPARAAEPGACAPIHRALADGKLVLLSFVSNAFARGCKDDETCNDWVEYLNGWREARRAAVEVIVVP